MPENPGELTCGQVPVPVFQQAAGTPDKPGGRPIPGSEKHPSRGVVLFTEAGPGGLQVVSCSPQAAAQGITPGMPLAEATGVMALPEDPRAALADLQRLAAVCQRFSPLAGLEEGPRPESLLLDLTGCGRVFGGEERLARLVLREFVQRGFEARVAVADTIGAAWALAHAACDSRAILVSPGNSAAALRPLPVALLRLPAGRVSLLQDLGVQQIGQLMSLPRASLPARLGPEVIDRLDQALGELAELLVPYRPPAPVEACWSFEEPTDRRRTLEAALEQLLQQVIQRLQGLGQGVRQLVCRFEGSPRAGSPAQPLLARLRVELVQASLSLRHLGELVRMQLEKLDWAAPVATVRVRATATAPLDCRQTLLFDAGPLQAAPRHLASLVDRLTGRLGRQSVLRARLIPDAQPEFACRYEPLVEGSLATRPGPRASKSARRRRKTAGEPPVSGACGLPCRPLRLLSPPRQVAVTSVHPDGPPTSLHWQGQTQAIARCRGPERIETGWWRSRSVRRDYYRVEIETGQRLWVFRERNSGEWYLHGRFE